ncbi:MAG TPA: tail protein X [Allosphingosinicella sp.]|uniref:tail protein X n=1 Tax=Allosphingosinicella sp. TaxID=2823234 RepID=UPI002ED9AEDD
MDTLKARQGDTVDLLIWRERGLGAEAIGQVLDVNPGLADQGAVLPMGAVVTVPAIAPASADREIIQLWD